MTVFAGTREDSCGLKPVEVDVEAGDPLLHQPLQLLIREECACADKLEEAGVDVE